MDLNSFKCLALTVVYTQVETLKLRKYCCYMATEICRTSLSSHKTSSRRTPEASKKPVEPLSKVQNNFLRLTEAEKKSSRIKHQTFCIHSLLGCILQRLSQSSTFKIPLSPFFGLFSFYYDAIQ